MFMFDQIFFLNLKYGGVELVKYSILTKFELYAFL